MATHLCCNFLEMSLLPVQGPKTHSAAYGAGANVGMDTLVWAMFGLGGLDFLIKVTILFYREVSVDRNTATETQTLK